MLNVICQGGSFMIHNYQNSLRNLVSKYDLTTYLHSLKTQPNFSVYLEVFHDLAEGHLKSS